MLAELHWIVPDRLAGSARPGLLSALDDDLDHLARLGVERVVTLTEAALDLGERSVPFAVTHFPIPDMGVPTPRAALAVCLDAIEHMAQGEPVLFHCKAGLGRTGTMLGACLITLGDTAEDAITALRVRCAGYVQSPAQVAFLSHYEELVRSEDAVPAPGGPFPQVGERLCR